MKTNMRANIAVWASLVAILASGPRSRAASFLELSDIENVSVVHAACSFPYGRCFRFLGEEGESPYWGHIFDGENRFYDKGSGGGSLRIQACLYSSLASLSPTCGGQTPVAASCVAQSGDNLFLTYDGGQEKHVFLPPLDAFTELYVGSDGSTYYDSWLTQTAQEALPPSPTPTLTPEGYRTPSPTPMCMCTPTPTAGPTCACCPSSEPRLVTLNELSSSAIIAYDSTYSCQPNPAELLDWWTSCTDWIEVTPSRGFGLDGQVYPVQIALGDTPPPLPGWHGLETASFYIHDHCCDHSADVFVSYGDASPTPEPTQTPSPKPSSSPTATPSPGPSPTPSVSCDFSLGGHVVNAVLYESISGAEVRLAFADGQSQLTTTDENGAYGFSVSGDHPAGTVSVEARRRGFDPGHRRNEIWWDCQTAIGNFDLQLTPRYDSAGVAGGDYDGDGRSDIAVFRPRDVLWAVRNITRIFFGSEDDELAPGDYDGDGTTEAAIFRPESALYAVRNLTRISVGQFLDVPVPNDYAGDGTCRMAIFRPWVGLWAVIDFSRWYWGVNSPRAVPGDYDGDGTTDAGYFEMEREHWRIRIRTDPYGYVDFAFGASGDYLAPGDYAGDGTAAAATFRGSSSLWSVRNLTRLYLGGSADWGVPGDYDGNGRDMPAIFRDSAGMWSVRNLTRVYFGATGDIPVTR